MPRLKPRPTLRLERRGGQAVEPHQVAVLEAIHRYGSLMKAAQALRVSYKHIWATVRRVERAIGEKLVEAKHGGRGGGGHAQLTEQAIALLQDYRRVSKGLQGIVREEGFWEALGIKVSARNRLKGRVRSVQRDRLAARVVVEVEVPTRITALITREAADDLGLKVGDKVEALIKSTEVIVAKRTSAA